MRQDETKSGKFIDLIAFGEQRNAEIEKYKGKNGTWFQNNTALKWLKDYIKDDKLNINDINKRFLENFETFMRSKNLGTAGISSYMRALRTMFLSAMDEYNDETKEQFYIKHYPFRKYKVAEHRPEKRSASIELIKKIRDYQPPTTQKRAVLAKDMFFLILYLGGIAPIDLYQLQAPKKGRIEYYRDKVKHRANMVKLSIKIQPEADEIIKRYSKPDFLSEIKKYASEKEFSRAIAKGFETLCDEKKGINIDEKITAYWARHSFATIAVDLGFDTGKVDFALGHSPSKNKMAEVYIKRSKETIDEIVRAEINEILDLYTVNYSI